MTFCRTKTFVPFDARLFVFVNEAGLAGVASACRCRNGRNEKARQVEDLTGLFEQRRGVAWNLFGRRYWVRTNDLYDVNVAL